MKTLNVKRRKQGGFVLTAELVLIVTILVFGMIVGYVTMRDALTAEMEDVAEAIGALDQSYEFDGLANPQLSAFIAGSSWDDAVDANAGDGAEFFFTPSAGEGPGAADNADGASSAAAPGNTVPTG